MKVSNLERLENLFTNLNNDSVRRTWGRLSDEDKNLFSQIEREQHSKKLLLRESFSEVDPMEQACRKILFSDEFKKTNQKYDVKLISFCCDFYSKSYLLTSFDRAKKVELGTVDLSITERELKQFVAKVESILLSLNKSECVEKDINLINLSINVARKAGMRFETNEFDWLTSEDHSFFSNEFLKSLKISFLENIKLSMFRQEIGSY